jgi:hypothetical protein
MESKPYVPFINKTRYDVNSKISLRELIHMYQSLDEEDRLGEGGRRRLKALKLMRSQPRRSKTSVLI